jgi:hypothetical protein
VNVIGTKWIFKNK